MMAENLEKTNKKKGGNKQQSSKKDGAAKRGRNKNIDGRMNTIRNTKRRLRTEANKAANKLEKLLTRGEAGKPGGIKPGSKRAQRLQAHINRLDAQAK